MKNRLVAHRGDMTTYPENSLLALGMAAKLGFSYLELDIQISKDIKPIVIHDDNLIRTTGIDKDVFKSTAKELMNHCLLTTMQDDKSKYLLRITTLKTVEVLNNYPDITLFVEIKKQSLEHVDLETVVGATLKDLESAKFNVVIISFEKELIEYLLCKSNFGSGWVLRKYDQAQHEIAKRMQPDFLFCNVKKINKPAELWQGTWRWVLYDIKNPAFAYELLKQGVDLIETGDIVKLNTSEYFK